MKMFYALFAAATLTLIAPAARAAAPGTDDPTEMARKATAREKVATAAKAAKAARAVKKASTHRFHRLNSGLSHAMLVLLGMEDSKAVTSPAKRDRQLHIHQKHLKTKAKLEAKARRRRTTKMLG